MLCCVRLFVSKERQLLHSGGPYGDALFMVYIFSNFVNMENTDENVQAPIVNTYISIRNTENVHDSVIQQQDNTDNEVVADFTAGPYVTRRNPAAEITSMCSRC